MLPRLLSFVLRTRFSRPFLVLMGVVLVYSVFVRSFAPQSTVDTVFGLYAAATITLFLPMALLTGGVMVMKSDRDYLFTLPLSARDLSLSIFFAQFVAFGTTVLLMFVYLAGAFTSPLMIVDMVALALVFTSLGVIAPMVTTRVRIVLSATLALWSMLAFVGFPFTPGSAFNGNLLGGTATLLALSAATVPMAFRGLGRVELDVMRGITRTTSAEAKSQDSYAGKSPLGAIYSMNLTNISIAGRMNMAGTARFISKRIRTRWVVAASSAAAIVYFAFAFSFGRVPAVSGTDTFPAAILVADALSMLAFFFSQSAITNERIWLSLTSLPVPSYFRHLVAAKLLSLLVILAPFAVADAVLFGMGLGGGAGPLGVILLVIPGAFVLEICWAAYVAPIQVKGDDTMMPAQFSIKQLLTALPLGGALLLASAASFVPSVAAIGGVSLCLLSAVLVLSPGFWTRVLVRLTESGFV